MQNKDMNTQDQLPLVVGVDLGGTQIRTAILRGPTLLSRVGLLTGENPLPGRIVPRIYTAIQEALDKAGATLEQMAGIGIAAPGPLDYRTGVIFTPPNLAGWDHVPLRDIFTEHFHIPIYVENDAHTAGLGEYMFGAGRGANNIVYLTISTGIGGGVIINGKILEGANGTAGELGHMTIDWHGDDPSTVELHSSIFTEPDELNVDTQTGSEQRGGHLHVNARTVALAAEAGVPLARAIIQNTAEAIGVGLVNIIHCFNPEIIILGGGVTQMGPMLMEPALRVVQERAMKFPRESVRIVQAQLGHNAGLIGAGALIYYHKNIKI
ncbi:MAG: ROK family protein [Chloroflexi bacterium]|nr:MAG: ROK family protein [Chloroflexota bacterium]